MNMTYEQAREAVRDICHPHFFSDIKGANKDMKKYFGNRLSQIKTIDEDTVAYYILTEDEGELELSCITYDFWNDCVA